MSDDKPAGSPAGQVLQLLQEIQVWMTTVGAQLIKTGEVLGGLSLVAGEAYERVVILQAVLQDKGILTEADVVGKRQVLKDVLGLEREMGDNPKPE
jgi:hypothetical protein